MSIANTLKKGDEFMTKSKVIIITGIVLCLCVVAVSAQAQKLMSVQVKKAQLRSTPSFLGKIVTTISYTKQVDVLEEKGAWMRVIVPANGSEGWMHSSALSKKKIVLKAGAEDVSKAASSDEVALAGKGFNASVEEQFKAENASVNYAVVDRMERTVISQNQMQTFLEQGGVVPEGGSE